MEFCNSTAFNNSQCRAISASAEFSCVLFRASTLRMLYLSVTTTVTGLFNFRFKLQILYENYRAPLYKSSVIRAPYKNR